MYEPEGVLFYDQTGRKTMKLVTEDGDYKGWLVYKHPDGQWVTLRKATQQDKDSIHLVQEAVACTK